ncbi:hypothetical protein Taro_036397 [Colocasia esculenta]|uniref:Uncharacterized protein n=1 Tax=Colocasia esculenta TaxID=4460 RepID=A0A843W8B5_COLES|nr:hypothetical protein [Colocasia esculenta]
MDMSPSQSQSPSGMISSAHRSPGEPSLQLFPLPRKPFRVHAVLPLHKFLATRVHPIWLHLCYFASLSLLGFLLLKLIPPRAAATAPAQAPSGLDVFFMSVSAATVSSMGVVEMEFFSNLQLVVLTVLMLMGGEVFTSMLALYLRRLDVEHEERETTGELVASDDVHGRRSDDHIELGARMAAAPGSTDTADGRKLQLRPLTAPTSSTADREYLRTRAARCLGFVVLGYFLAANLVGSSLVLAYLNAVPTARDVVRSKNIPLPTFAVFSVVSSFGNCGFIPTNENMIVFREHSGLLLLIAAVILAGNTLYPPLLRAAIWAVGRWTGRAEYEHMVRNRAEMEYDHLLPARHCHCLAATVAGFVLVQAVAFCCMEWRSGGLEGMGGYQKVVAALFMAVNSRHAGESVVDLARVSSAVLVLYVVMMYLPPYTAFMPVGNDHDHAHSGDQPEKDETAQGVPIGENLIFSQLSYIAVFTILICITERKKLSQDPLNFNVLSIVIEVVSAYGNVGFSTGYSCGRRLKADSDCKDMWYGFSGRWSDGGKLLLICVMLFGRLKKFGINKGGKAWKLA